MEKEFLENQKQLNKEGYVIVSSYFLDYGVEILGSGPGMLYIQLLNYCHKGKDIAWPTLVTLGRKMQFTPKSITKFHQVLLKHGLIKKVIKGKTPSGNYNRNVYQVVPIHRVKNTLTTGKNFPKVEEKITPDIGKKLPTNNTNLNITNITAAKREKDAVVVAVNFKKLKEEGEEKMQAVRERMVELDFKEEFIEKILKEYSVEKIEEKLDLLMERRNIQSPAGWLKTALKNDYRDGEQNKRGQATFLNDTENMDEEKSSLSPFIRRERDNLIDTPEWTSREKALEAIKLIQDNLSACISPPPSGKGTVVRENVGADKSAPYKELITVNEKLISTKEKFICPN